MFVYFHAVYIQNILFNAEKELCLVSIVDYLSGPFRFSPAVVIIRTGEHRPEMLSNGSAIYHLPKTGWQNIMLYDYAMQTAIGIYTVKPFRDSRIQFNRSSIGSQILPVQNNLSPRQIQHQIHIRWITVHIIIFCKIIGSLPELSYIGPKWRNISILHILRRQRIIKIITNSQYRLLIPRILHKSLLLQKYM